MTTPYMVVILGRVCAMVAYRRSSNKSSGLSLAIHIDFWGLLSDCLSAPFFSWFSLRIVSMRPLSRRRTVSHCYSAVRILKNKKKRALDRQTQLPDKPPLLE